MLPLVKFAAQCCLALTSLSLCMKLAGLISLNIALNPEPCVQMLNKLAEGLVGQTQVRRPKNCLMPLLKLQVCLCSFRACVHLEVAACACGHDSLLVIVTHCLWL